MKKNTKILFIIISLILVFLLLILPMGITIYAYQANFGMRVDTNSSATSYTFSDFPNLNMEEISFTSNKKQTLRGYIYSTNSINKDYKKSKGLIVFSHGYLGTHINYLNQISYFAENGYTVLGFDNTGSGMSDGDNLIGLAQSPLDLNAALKFVSSNNKINTLPIFLYGHSWGGYAVCAVLNYHPNVKAVVSRSGFNNSRDMLVEYGSRLYGNAISLLSPYVYLYEKAYFGEAVDLNGIKGINNSEAPILLLHSQDDPVISVSNSLYIHKDEYTHPERITAILYQDKGHDVVQSNASINYTGTDKEKINELDETVMKQILDFYDKQL